SPRPRPPATWPDPDGHRARPPVPRAPDRGLLVRALALEDGEEGAPQDDEVHREGPVLDVAQVEPDRLVPVEVGTAADLPEAGEPGLDHEPAVDVLLVGGDLAGQRR